MFGEDIMTPTVSTPEMMPVLSRGKHRNPRRGACFMEMASFLAGERWSDHPACTHPLLAGLARLVNDFVGDGSRAELVPLIPSVIGLTSEDPHLDAAIARRATLVALPIAALPRQHVLATAVLACERFLAGLDGRDPDYLSPQSRDALARVPEAEAWARSFSGGRRLSPRTFRARTAPHIVSIAVESIALSCVPDVEQRLIDLLAATIDDCEASVTDAMPATTTSATTASTTTASAKASDHLTDAEPG
jgi:hypothetical protein